MCIVRELAGGGSVSVAVNVGDNIYIYIFVRKNTYNILVLVLKSTHIERFRVSHMHDFRLYRQLWNIQHYAIVILRSEVMDILNVSCLF